MTERLALERRKFWRSWNCGAIAVCTVVGVASWAWLASADTPGEVKLSPVVPADDLKSQVDFYLGRLQESLASGQDYDEAKQSRVWKDANTLAALALVLGMVDKANPLQKSAPQLGQWATALAEAKGNYEQAAEALAEVKEVAAGRKSSALPTSSRKAATLEPLMKQTPIVHAAMKRGIEGRFQKQASQAAGQAATLSAIAVTAALVPPDKSDLNKWRDFCAEMRDAAGEINSAAHAGDQAAARAGLVRLSKSCDACHEVYRKEK
jgi:cytochrome c556